MKIDRKLAAPCWPPAQRPLRVQLLLVLAGGGLAWSTLAMPNAPPPRPSCWSGCPSWWPWPGWWRPWRWAVQPLYRRWVAAPARLQEQAQVLLSPPTCSARCRARQARRAVQALARTINELAAQRDQLKRDIAAEVAQASRGIEQERNRLAALMSELTQSVVVCNLDGRVLLYNNRARMQFRALSDAPRWPAGPS
jgi:PAS domain-containing protein